MANKFLNQLSKEKTDYVPRKQKQAGFPKKVKRVHTSEPTETVRVRKSTHDLLGILKMATNKKHIDLIDEALHYYMDVLSLDNPKIKALKALHDDYQEVDEEQMSIEDFMN